MLLLHICEQEYKIWHALIIHVFMMHSLDLIC